MPWVPIDDSDLDFDYSGGADTSFASSTVSVSGSVGGSSASWSIAINPPADPVAIPVRVTIMTYEDVGVGFAALPEFTANGGLFSQQNESGTPNTEWSPNPVEFEVSVEGGSTTFTYAARDAEVLDESYTMLVEVWQGSSPLTTSYNCSCDDTTNNRTLKSLRDDLMRRLGWGATVNNPPPGVADMLNSFLIEAQELLYRRYKVLRTERFYSWPLMQGVRLYDLPDNQEVCSKKLDPRSLTWVGAVRDEIWYPLTCGIDPSLYSHGYENWPQRYEIRQCIEVWPAPAETQGELVIKGHFGLEAFSADTDKVTIDDRAVFLMALANAKAHYRQPDAGNYVQQLEVYIDNLVAGAHLTRRYIPGQDDRCDYVYTRPVPLVPFT